MAPVRLLVSALMLIASAASASAEPDRLNLELNKLEPVENGCRAYLVFDNATDSAFDVFKIELVMFGSDGVIAKRMALDAAPLPADKTIVKPFDIQGVACSDLGRVLVNRVTGCADQSGARTDCTALIEPTARGTVPLVR